ncbi:MAG: 2-dehydropantoate 2-reductase [Chloroflexi bacterium]|nr:2-dehydropantoate 2-reductase [Chloroflexota bacterium]MDA1228931.1 2-dehydropantoate 2-reductase [Chloroflexota bacterium]
MGKRIAVFGAGAAGSYIGAFLTREGHDITLIDMWGQHVDAMNEKGLSVQGSQGPFTVPVKAVHVTDAINITEPFDIIFLAVKSYDTEWSSHFIKRFLSPTGVVVNSQNCMNDALTASIVGYERQVGCIMSSITVALWEPAVVIRGGQPGRDRGHDVYRVGELHGQITPRVEEIAEMLSCIDGSHATSNIWGERWSKLTTNSVGNPVGAMTGQGSQTFALDPRARLIQVQIAKETCQVGLALNVNIAPVSGVEASTWAKADDGEVFEELDAKFQPKVDAADWRSSMAQDVVKGRHTEIEYMNGYTVKRGLELGIATPVSAAIVDVVKQIDAGTLKPDPSHVERVLSMAGL